MIDKLELKHNNYILDREGKILRIDWFEKDKVCFKRELEGVEVHPLTESFEYLHPIPLTEEILLKCGFEFEKDCFEEDNKWLNLNHGKHKFNTDTSVNYETVYYQCFKGSVEIKYLHQLQNIYFALTNKELEIKL